jgi:hypothetical protein
LIRKIRKAVRNGALLLCVAALGLRSILELIYFDNPRQPDPATGRTAPYLVKNAVIYITDDLSAVLHWLQWGFTLFGAIVVISVILELIWPLVVKNAK